MELLPLTNNRFDGAFGVISRRAVLLELAKTRTVYESPFDRKMKVIRYCILTCTVTVLASLSCFILADILGWDKGYNYAVREIYKGNSAQVETNKKKAMAKIAGTGDQGPGQVIQGNH